MDFITPERVAVTIYNVCQQTQTDVAKVPDWTDVATLLGTAAVESNFILGKKEGRKQAALGIFGLPIQRVETLYRNFDVGSTPWSWLHTTKAQKRTMSSWSIFTKAWLGIANVPYIDMKTRDLRYLMAHDLAFAASMCRWFYLNMTSQDQDPETLSEVADLWRSAYNTDPDRTQDTFLNAWDDLECKTLMGVLGYQ